MYFDNLRSDQAMQEKQNELWYTIGMLNVIS